MTNRGGIMKERMNFLKEDEMCAIKGGAEEIPERVEIVEDGDPEVTGGNR